MFERFRVFKLVQIGINDGSITAMGVEVSTCARKVGEMEKFCYKVPDNLTISINQGKQEKHTY